MPDVLVENMSIRMANARFMTITLASSNMRAKLFHAARSRECHFVHAFADFDRADDSHAMVTTRAP